MKFKFIAYVMLCMLPTGEQNVYGIG